MIAAAPAAASFSAAALDGRVKPGHDVVGDLCRVKADRERRGPWGQK
jgi:hypothetical protein